MNNQDKKDKIKSLVVDMLNDSHDNMIKNIDKVLKSGAINIDRWDEENEQMIIPKIIVTAILKNESGQYEGKGTSFERRVSKEVKNLMYFL